MGTESTKSLALLIIWGNSIFNVMSIQKFRQVSPRFEELPLTTVLSNYLRTKVAIYNEKFRHAQHFSMLDFPLIVGQALCCLLSELFGCI